MRTHQTILEFELSLPIPLSVPVDITNGKQEKKLINCKKADCMIVNKRECPGVILGVIKAKQVQRSNYLSSVVGKKIIKVTVVFLQANAKNFMD